MPTETTAPRLIDANALKEILESYVSPKGGPFQYGFFQCMEDVMDAIESAPTVETTDDVMARITEGGRTITISPWSTGFGVEGYGKFADGNTLLEAVKKLEATLNSK